VSQHRATSAWWFVDRLRRREITSSWRETSVAPDQSRLEDFVKALHDDARYASAYDRLFSSLELTARSRSGRRVLVTSARPGEGKSTVVINLALAMSLAGRRVLVVDADLRCPTLHQLLDLPNHSGLANVLSGERDVSDVLQTVAIEAPAGPARCLKVITSGAVSPDSVHLLGLPRMAATLEGLIERFDFVLLDSPPVLPVNDPIVLATVTDMVLLVIQAGTASGHEVRRARQRLESVGTTVVGSVLTRCDGAAEEDGHYQYPYGPTARAD
jgi:capsular exopolysaccharide synthesis family protein